MGRHIALPRQTAVEVKARLVSVTTAVVLETLAFVRVLVGLVPGFDQTVFALVLDREFFGRELQAAVEVKVYLVAAPSFADLKVVL